MKVNAFKCEIKYINYKQFENKSRYSNEEISYLCNAIVAEVGRGMAKSKQLHNVVFYLNKEDFDNQIIEKGDIIAVNDGAKWKCSVVKWKNKNNDSNPSFKNKIFSYKVECKYEDFSIDTKWYDMFYCSIDGIRIKLPLDSQKHFDNDVLEFILDANEVEKVKPINQQVMLLKGYKKTTKFAEKKVKVALINNEETGSNLSLFVAGDE